MFNNIYKDKKIFITGSTGFKGSWLVGFLLKLGAQVSGYSLNPYIRISHFHLLNYIGEEPNFFQHIDNIINVNHLKQVIKDFQPDLVIHMAAQPIVKDSYEDPSHTFKVNVTGTINLLEACRGVSSIQGVIVVTTDKVYKEKDKLLGYIEYDEIGGHDPYSTSKACTELITECYKKCFFQDTSIATVRAGNVIGGGDWGYHRIIPDIIRAVAKNEKVIIRNPKATRPFQHVLDCLHGYLLLGQKFLESKKGFEGAWNFGPNPSDIITVETLLKKSKKIWNKIDYDIQIDKNAVHEAGTLKLNSLKANKELKWSPLFNIDNAIRLTIEWYKECLENNILQTENQLDSYINYFTNK